MHEAAHMSICMRINVPVKLITKPPFKLELPPSNKKPLSFKMPIDDIILKKPTFFKTKPCYCDSRGTVAL